LITETYTLAAFFTCLLLFLTARWRARGCQAHDLRLIAVTYGFTLTCHQTNTLFLPGFIGFILWSQPALLGLRQAAVRRQWLRTLVCALPPLLFYLYLPIRAHTHPAYNWGDPETPFAFLYHVTGRAFASIMFHQQLAHTLMRLTSWGCNLGRELSWPVIALAALGLASLWRRDAERPIALLLTWVLFADVGFVINYAIYNGYIYYIPCYIVLSVCAGRGLLGLWQALELRLEPGRRPTFAALGAVCVLALVPLQAFTHSYVSLRGNWTCYDYGRNLLASVPPHGLLIENGDDTATSSVLYLQIVEKVRPDVTQVRRGCLAAVFDPDCGRWANLWYIDMLRRTYPRIDMLYPNHTLTPLEALSEGPMRRLIADAVAHHVPVCVLAPAGEPPSFSATPAIPEEDGREVGFDRYLDRHYDTAPIGLVTRIFPSGGRPSGEGLYVETERLWHSYALRGVFDGRLQQDHFLTLLALTYGHGSLARGQLAYAQGDQATAEQAFSDVLALFTSDEATQGLDRSRKATRLLSARNGPACSHAIPNTPELENASR